MAWKKCDRTFFPSPPSAWLSLRLWRDKTSFKHTWNMFSQAIAFLRFFLSVFFFFLFVFYKLPFSSSETRTHDMDEKTKSFILISGKRGAGEGGRLWQNFLLVFGVKKFYLSLHGESIRKSAHVPSWWLSDFFFSSSSCFIRKQLLGGKNALLRTKRSKLSGKLQSSFDNAREKDLT